MNIAIPSLDTAAIEERLTMTGTKVETILHHGVPSVENFVVGRVLTAEPHPDADRLKVCTVDVGADEPAGIVCGAPNVAAGQTVAVALPGARMPDGTKIKAAKLRGVPSNGMILAADELQIDNDHSGIMVLDELILDAELAPGTPLADVLASLQMCWSLRSLRTGPTVLVCTGSRVSCTPPPALRLRPSRGSRIPAARVRCSRTTMPPARAGGGSL